MSDFRAQTAPSYDIGQGVSVPRPPSKIIQTAREAAGVLRQAKAQLEIQRNQLVINIQQIDEDLKDIDSLIHELQPTTSIAESRFP